MVQLRQWLLRVKSQGGSWETWQQEKWLQAGSKGQALHHFCRVLLNNPGMVEDVKKTQAHVRLGVGVWDFRK